MINYYDNSHKIANALIAFMDNHGLSKGSLAVLLDVKSPVITKYLSGTHNFTVKTICDIESKLSITILRNSKELLVKESHLTEGWIHVQWHNQTNSTNK